MSLLQRWRDRKSPRVECPRCHGIVPLAAIARRERWWNALFLGTSDFWGHSLDAQMVSGGTECHLCGRIYDDVAERLSRTDAKPEYYLLERLATYRRRGA